MLGYNATLVAALTKLQHVTRAGDDHRDCLLALNALVFCRGILCTVSRDERSGDLMTNAYVLSATSHPQYVYTMFDCVYMLATGATGSWRCIKHRLRHPDV